ncbi:hypothetical protein DFQ28_001140 [Apophysomyces sp. BC1034]|nr:hypothetical protein DFQ30_001876 [Apophysomyces sp. BC1015]KAG0183723.1 hypothetical protein DFQ28_001140 [Apophysomyces sp. BC1034]
MAFPHLKNKAAMQARPDESESRTIKSTDFDEVFLDLPARVIALALLKGIAAIDSFQEWYLSDKVMFPIRAENLDEPVFCSMRRALYAIRRGFLQAAISATTREQTTSLATHCIDTSTLLNHYSATNEDVDGVSLVLESKYKKTNIINALIAPIRILVKDTSTYKLTDEEYQNHVVSDKNVAAA